MRLFYLKFVMVTGLMLVPVVARAQTAGDRELFGHYFDTTDAKRIADRVNAGDAPGWKDAVYEITAHPVTKTFGVYARRFDPRLPKDAKAALAITMSWNTKTDVDLWVTEPGGEKCYYGYRTTKSGGKLHEDNTTGYGPEHYTSEKTVPGEYIVQVNLFSIHKEKQPIPTIVTVQVTRYAGTPQATHQTYTVHVRSRGDTVEVCRIKN